MNIITLNLIKNDQYFKTFNWKQKLNAYLII